jgi:hypothetical protein
VFVIVATLEINVILLYAKTVVRLLMETKHVSAKMDLVECFVRYVSFLTMKLSNKQSFVASWSCINQPQYPTYNTEVRTLVFIINNIDEIVNNLPDIKDLGTNNGNEFFSNTIKKFILATYTCVNRNFKTLYIIEKNNL